MTVSLRGPPLLIQTTMVFQVSTMRYVCRQILFQLSAVRVEFVDTGVTALVRMIFGFKHSGLLGSVNGSFISFRFVVGAVRPSGVDAIRVALGIRVGVIGRHFFANFRGCRPVVIGMAGVGLGE